MDGIGDEHAAGISQGFDPRGDIDAAASRPTAKPPPDLSGAVRRSSTALAAVPSIRGRSGISLPSGRNIAAAPKIGCLIDNRP